MKTSDNAVLAALDFHTIGCQHHPRCDRQASHVVELHAVDRCNDTGHPFGNVVILLCEACVRSVTAMAEAYVRRLTRYGDHRAACLTCGAPIAVGDDLLRSVSAL